ncbi:MAG: glucosamine-6-phosphate deaminase [Clostridia bacterium]|nr:glucosamine-6-phosphate deaminase [Clostridia bacterium]
MKLIVCESQKDLGIRSADHVAALINEAIAAKGSARILLSTGASQFPFFDEFVQRNIDWSKVEMFHLDEYVGISKDHPASFNFYLTNRFVNKVNPGKYHLIDGTKDPEETIAELTALLDETPVDVGLIGIGENAHIAFNDPPADFADKRAYKVVTLAERCLEQQIGEGWFKSKEEAFKQAISMTCDRIMQCKHIISVVPYAVKAEAIAATLANDVTPDVPATLLKKHADTTVYCDPDSASLLDAATVEAYR